MTRLSITPLPAAPLHVLELWGNPAAPARRIAKACGFELPAMGRWAAGANLRMARFEPTVWLAEGDLAPLAKALGKDGALTAIGGGTARVRIAGKLWRRLLMEGAVFDAQNPAFSPGCCASSVIDHVNVRLLVTGEDECLALVPASYLTDLLHFWQAAREVILAEAALGSP